MWKICLLMIVTTFAFVSKETNAACPYCSQNTGYIGTTPAYPTSHYVAGPTPTVRHYVNARMPGNRYYGTYAVVNARTGLETGEIRHGYYRNLNEYPGRTIVRSPYHYVNR